MNRAKRELIFDKLATYYPAPKTELQYTTPFELLIATILSAQATDVSVNKATQVLYKVANTPKQLLALGEVALKGYIKTIGLYNSKAVNIIKTCSQLIEQHDGQVPHSLSELIKLPGVGRKTANVVLNVAFGEPTCAVDTHVFRVSNRTKIAPGKNVVEVEHKLLKFIPKPHVMTAHHLLILHGRYTCMARKPRCGSCVIEQECEFKDKCH